MARTAATEVAIAELDTGNACSSSMFEVDVKRGPFSLKMPNADVVEVDSTTDGDSDVDIEETGAASSDEESEVIKTQSWRVVGCRLAATFSTVLEEDAQTVVRPDNFRALGYRLARCLSELNLDSDCDDLL